VKILVVSDEESPYYWDYYRPGRLSGIDLILSCGDLKADYLSFLVTMGHAPLYYVRGNHDVSYDKRPPEGCDCIEDKLVTVNGVRILGLGGSPLYSGGPNQYTERQMAWRIRRLGFQLRRAKGVDLVLTHAPVRGHGDADDPAHRGFEAFLPLLDKYHPRYLVHGHVHLRYGIDIPRTLSYNGTTLVNACGYYTLEL
jgi:Icc-related predicted phosphoesterase